MLQVLVRKGKVLFMGRGKHAQAISAKPRLGNPCYLGQALTNVPRCYILLPDAMHLKNRSGIEDNMPIGGAFRRAAEAAPVLAQGTLKDRATLLEHIASSLAADGKAIVECCQKETSYPAERVQGEFRRMLALWTTFAEVVRNGGWLEARIDAAQPDRQPMPKPDIRRMNVPVGPVVIFGSSNFPLALGVAGSDPVSALAAGCPVLVKGHPSHAGTSELLRRAIVRVIQESGFPTGVYQQLEGESYELGQALVRHPETRAVGFTGSLRGGRALYDIAAARPDPIPVYAEMGSVNPQFVFPDILAESPEAFAERLFGSVTLGNGQFCTCPGLVFVPKRAGLDVLIKRYVSLAKSAKALPMLNGGMATTFADGVTAWKRLGGVTLHVDRPCTNDFAVSPVIAQTDFDSFMTHRDGLLEEVFGPATLLVVCEELAQFNTAAAVMGGQLGASIHSESGDTQLLMLALQRFAGRIVVNGFPTGIETTHAMHHGGPYPATTHSQFTSLGQSAIRRWLRPVCFQDTPNSWLPEALQDDNPLGIPRMMDGVNAAH